MIPTIVTLAFVLAMIVVGVAAMRTSRRQNELAGQALSTPLDPELHRRIHELLSRNKKILAVKDLREATDYRLFVAKSVVDAMAEGNGPGTIEAVVPSAGPDGAASAPTADLAVRVRELRAAGREVDAIRMVCDETGMGILDAQKFVRALD